MRTTDGGFHRVSATQKKTEGARKQVLPSQITTEKVGKSSLPFYVLPSEFNLRIPVFKLTKQRLIDWLV